MYGEDFPNYSASYDGFVNGDDEGDVDGLEITGGAPSGADVGDYPINVSSATSPNYDIDYVSGTEHVTPAPLTITADDKIRVYGEDFPNYSASYDGFVNGDDEGDVDGLEITGGAPSGADVGDYPINVSGATSPNYDIDYVSGTEHVTPRPTHDHRRRQDQGLRRRRPGVHGVVRRARQRRHEGRRHRPDLRRATERLGRREVRHHAVRRQQPQLQIKYAAGTQTITPAPLTIRPADVAWHRGRRRRTPGTATVGSTATATPPCPQPGRTPPTCTATVGAPGEYAGAVTCSGAYDANYDIAYAKAALRVDPVIFLDQRGLPDDVGQKAYLDGSSVDLPVVSLDVRFGSRHSYRFPPVRLGDAGTTYVTKAERFDGPVTANIDVTARYLTMHKVLRRAEVTGGIGRKEAVRLDQRWDDIQALIDPRRNAKLQAALHRFADRVRAHTGDDHPDGHRPWTCWRTPRPSTAASAARGRSSRLCVSVAARNLHPRVTPGVPRDRYWVKPLQSAARSLCQITCQIICQGSSVPRRSNSKC